MGKKFCCNIFSDSILETHKKGFSIMPVKKESGDSYYFILQFRSDDYKKDQLTNQVVAQKAISYCPWCRHDLSNFFTQMRVYGNGS